MTLIQLAYLIYQVIAGQLSIQAALAKVLTYAQHAAQETAPLALQTIAANGTNTVINPTYGNSALRTLLLARFDAVDAAIAAITPTPPAPPPTAAENAQAVWSYGDPNSIPSGKPYGDEIWEPYMRAKIGNVYDVTSTNYAPMFLREINDNQGINPEYAYYPQPDWTDIRVDDSRLTWLNRTEPSFTWSEDGVSGTVSGYRTAAGILVTYWLALTEAEFAALRPRGSGLTAPVWPGLDFVELGTPVALGADVSVPGPLDGVLVAITTPPTGLGKFEMGGQTWWYRAGQIAFVTDNGDIEPWQYITWTHALYCPRQQTRADHAIVRGLAGIGGTVTPWLTT